MVADKSRVDRGFLQILADELVQKSGRRSWSAAIDVLFDADGVESGPGFLCRQSGWARKFRLDGILIII